MGIIELTIDRFLDDITGQYAQRSVTRFRSDLNTARRFEDTFEKASFLEMSQADLVQLFIQYHCFSVQTFRDKKSLLSRYVVWLRQQGYEVSSFLEMLQALDYGQVSGDNEFGRYYFGRLDQLCLFYEAHVGQIVKETGKDPEEFLSVAALCALSWSGFSVERACSLERCDVLCEQNRICIRKGSQMVRLEGPAADWVVKFRDAGGYERLKGGAWEMISYKKSTYLLRTTKSERMTPKSVANMFSRFNSFLPYADKIFTYGRIYSSGKFSRAYAEEIRRGENVMLSKGSGKPITPEERRYYEKLFGITYNRDNNYKMICDVRAYQEFKGYFYSQK